MTEKETNYANISTYKNNKMNNKSARVIAFYNEKLQKECILLGMSVC